MKLLIIATGLALLINSAWAQTSADAYYDLLDNQYRQNKSKSQTDFLIKEFKEYTLLFPNSKQEDEALFNLSQLYKATNNIAAQLFSLIKLRIIHPKSPLVKKAYQIIDSIVVYNNDLKLTDENEKAIKQITNMAPAGSHQLAFVEFLSFLHSAEIKVFDEYFIDEIRTYRVLYGKNLDNPDALNYWQACAYQRKGDLNAALLYFQKVTDINHESRFAAPSFLQRSEIYKNTNRLNKAADCLIELINQYPDARETGDAQYALAELYHYHYKDPQEALTNYKMLAQLFPENRHFNAALFNAAKISEELNNYDDALKSYMMIVENNAVSDETLNALKNILHIHLDVFKEYEQAAKDYILIAQMFPERKEAPQNLLSAAQIYRDNIKNIKKADEILKVIITNYAASPQAQQAEKILKKK